ncbi:unnamed protein product [Ilex paraguariensis]|uniref:Uncharacterized protein n=1 Tax=Ilex paraguariensis TaxID=185542 RepID=A0ABC8V278_9AQUA
MYPMFAKYYPKRKDILWIHQHSKSGLAVGRGRNLPRKSCRGRGRNKVFNGKRGEASVLEAESLIEVMVYETPMLNHLGDEKGERSNESYMDLCLSQWMSQVPNTFPSVEEISESKKQAVVASLEQPQAPC